MIIILIRHGEVENHEQLVYGRLPGYPLNKKGIDDINRLGKTLKDNYDISYIISSPLTRAKQTAIIISSFFNIKKEDIILDDRLTETDCNKWQGKPIRDLLERGLGDIEPIQQCGERVLNVIKDLCNKDNNIAIISHGHGIMGALSLITNEWSLIETSYVPPGGAYILRKITDVNSVIHLIIDKYYKNMIE